MPSPPRWLEVLGGRSEAAALVAGHDWSSTPLGDPAAWPEGLRVATQLCLSSQFPMLVSWGPELTMIYNDGYRLLLGSEKHVDAVGAPTAEVWRETWDQLGPLFDQVLSGGDPVWGEHLLLMLDRSGFLEEAFFTFCYSPLLDDHDAVAGVLDVVVETTAEVVAERRLGTVGRLAARLVAAPQVTDVCTGAVAALDGEADLPSAEIRLCVGEQLVPIATNDARLVAAVDADQLAAVLDGDDVVVLDEGWAPGRPAGRVAVPIGADEASGVLVVGLNPTRPYDDRYREFVELLGRTVGAALENAYRRSVELGEQRRISETLQAAMLQPASDLPTVAARYRPATGGLSVGGDWYDVISLADGRRALVVGDCVGHGLDAATVMGQLRSASRALLLEGRGPAEVVAGMDRFARSVEGASCTTMACALVDVVGRTITLSCAGHPPPLLVRDGEGSWLDGGRGTPLGVGEAARTEATHQLAEHDLLVLFSDGLVERRGEGIDDGLARLRVAVEANGGEPVQAVADAVLAEVLEAHPRDDVALLVKRVG